MAARSTRSAATERAYMRFGGAAAGGCGRRHQGGEEEFDESDIWGAAFSAPDADPAQPRHRPVVPAARKAAAAKKAVAHGSLPVNIPDWSKILGDEYRGRQAGDWELVDDADDEDVGVVDAGGAVVPPHELAWRRRAASLSVHDGAGGVGRTLKVRDAVWKRTTGFQD